MAESTIEQIGNLTVLGVPYDSLDADSADDFKSDMEPAIKDGARVVLDMSRVEFVNSAGLGSIVSSCKRLRAAGGELRISGLNKAIQALFELVRIHRLVDVYRTRDDAINGQGA